MSSPAFSFLYATRFWAMTIAAASYYLQRKGWIGEAEMTLIGTITAGFTIVRTIDRATEQRILASAVQAGQLPVQAVLEIPPVNDALGGATLTAAVPSAKGRGYDP